MDEDDDDPSVGAAGADGRWTEFDCPSCDANNPLGDGFRVGEEVSCLWCGASFRVRKGTGSRFRLKEP